MSILLGFFVSLASIPAFISNSSQMVTVSQFPVNAQIVFTDGVAEYRGQYNFRRSETEIAQNTVETMQDIARARILDRWKVRQAYKIAALPRQSFIANVSAYTAAADECGKSDGITASGVKVKEKTTLACPPEYPFGTKVNIDSVGTLTCEDRGGAIKGNKFDVYVYTKHEAFAFGRQNLTAQVIF